MKKRLFKPGTEVLCVNGRWDYLIGTPVDNQAPGPKRDEIVTVGDSYLEYNGKGFINLEQYDHKELYGQQHFVPVMSTRTLERLLNEIAKQIKQ